VNDIWTTIVGNVATTPKTSLTPDGVPVTSFRLASSRRYQDRATGRWVDGAASYVSVTCWRRLAENVSSSVSLGHPLVVYGRLTITEWERDGRKGSNADLLAQAVGHDMSRGTSMWAPSPRRQEAPKPSEVVEPAPAARPGAEAA